MYDATHSYYDYLNTTYESMNKNSSQQMLKTQFCQNNFHKEFVRVFKENKEKKISKDTPRKGR